MLIAKKYFAVNWVDGMKLTQQHFQETDLHVQDLVRDTASLPLTSYNYGLLPPLEKTAVSSEIQLLEKVGGSVEVKLLSCNAITAGGCRIAISADPNDSADYQRRASFTVNEQAGAHEHPDYYAVLTVHPFQRVPLGSPTPEESPLRHPYTDANYTLTMMPTAKVVAEKLGGYFLIVGRVIFTNGGYQVDDAFIPPCTAMDSHPRLVQYHKDFGWMLSQLQINSLRILKQVQDRQKSTLVGRSIQQLCLKILDYLDRALFTYRNLDAQRPPVFVLGHFSSLASVIQTALYCLPGQDREEVLDYFHEWSDIPPNSVRLEQLLRQMAELNYQHYNIGAAMQQADTFARRFENLWEKLSGLENIGQRKDNVVVYEETLPNRGADRRRSSSLLD